MKLSLLPLSLLSLVSLVSAEAPDSAGKCTLFMPPDNIATFSQCTGFCGNATDAAVAAGNFSSVSCIAFAPGKTTLDWVPFENGINMTLGNCSCNNVFIDELAETFIEALPIIANIGCQILFGALNLVSEIGAMAIPGVGEAVDAGMIAAITGSKVAAQAFDEGQQGLNAFAQWLNPCGTAGVPQDLMNVFGALNGANPAVLPKGFSVPKVPKDPNYKPPKEDPPPSPKESSAPKESDPPKESESPKSDAPNSTQPAKTSSPAESTRTATSEDATKTSHTATSKTTSESSAKSTATSKSKSKSKSKKHSSTTSSATPTSMATISGATGAPIPTTLFTLHLGPGPVVHPKQTSAAKREAWKLA